MRSPPLASFKKSFPSAMQTKLPSVVATKKDGNRVDAAKNCCLPRRWRWVSQQLNDKGTTNEEQSTKTIKKWEYRLMMFLYSFTVFNIVCPLTYHFLQLFIVGNTYMLNTFRRIDRNAMPLQTVRYIQFSASLFEKNYSMTILPVNWNFSVSE